MDFSNVNSVAEMLQQTEKESKKIDPEDLKLSDGLSHKYSISKTKVIESLLATIRSDKKLAPLAKEVNCSDNWTEKRPLLFEICSGKITKQKIKVLNSVLVNHCLTIKKKSGGEYQPNTICTHLKTIFSHLQSEGVLMKLAKHFRDFNGCLDAVLKKKWQKDHKSDCSFGTKPNTIIIKDDSIDRIRRYVQSVGESGWKKGNKKLIQEIVYWSLATGFALRGRDEHHSLQWSMVHFGRYGSSGPPGMAGVPFVELINLTDKTHQIDLGELFFFRKSNKHNKRTHLFL